MSSSSSKEEIIRDKNGERILKDEEIYRNPIPDTVVVQTGTGLAWVLFGVIIFSLLVIGASSYGASNSHPSDNEYYFFVAMILLSLVVIIICIVLYYTVVRSLQIEDIMITSIQRLTLGKITAQDFQVRAGEYFKAKITENSETRGLNNVGMSKYIGSTILEGLSGSGSGSSSKITL